MAEQADQLQRPRVADIISVYDPSKTSSPRLTRKLLSNNTGGSKGQPNEQKSKTSQDATPQPRTDGSVSPVPFKVIQIGSLGEVVDESNPRCSRTVNHYRSGGQLRPTSNTSKVAPIQTMSFKGPAYYGSSTTLNNKVSSSPADTTSSTPATHSKIDVGSSSSSTSSVGATSPTHSMTDAKDGTATRRDSQVVAVHEFGGTYYKKVDNSPEDESHSKTGCVILRAKKENDSTSKDSSSPRRSSAVYEPGGMHFTSKALSTGADVKRSHSFASHSDKSRPPPPSRRKSYRSSLVLDYEGEKSPVNPSPSVSTGTVTLTSSGVVPPSVTGEMPTGSSSPKPTRIILQQAPVKSHVQLVSTTEPQTPLKEGSEVSVDGPSTQSSSVIRSIVVDSSTLPEAESTPSVTGSPKLSQQAATSTKKQPVPPIGKKEKSDGSFLLTSGKQKPPKANQINEQLKNSSSKQETSAASCHTPNNHKLSPSPVMQRIERYNSCNARPEPKLTPPKDTLKSNKSPVLPHKPVPLSSTPKASEESSAVQRPVSPALPVARKYGSDHTPSQQSGTLTDKKLGLSPPVHKKPMRSKSLERKVGPPTLPKPSRFENIQQNHSLPRHASISGYTGRTRNEANTPPTQSKLHHVTTSKVASDDKWQVAPSSNDSEDNSQCSPRMHEKATVASTDASESSNDRIDQVFKKAMECYGMSVKSRIALFQNDKTPTQRPTRGFTKPPPKSPHKHKDAVATTKPAECLEMTENTSDDGRDSASPQLRMRIPSIKDGQSEDDSIGITVFDEDAFKATTEVEAVASEEAEKVEEKTISSDVPLDNTEVTPEINDSETTIGLSASKSDSNVNRRFSESPIYSYQEYANLRKRHSLPGGTQTDAAKLLKGIPEASQPFSPPPITEEDTENDAKPEKISTFEIGGESLPDVSSSFFDEVFSSLTTIIGKSGGLSSHEIAKVVDGVVSFEPKLSSHAEDIYESVEAYGRRVSHYFHMQDQEDSPPELPPRPDFLQKLILSGEEQEEEELSLLEDQDRLMMHRQRAQTLDNIYSNSIMPFIEPPSRTFTKSPNKMMRFFSKKKPRSRHFSFLSNKIEPSSHVEHVTEMDDSECDTESHKDADYKHHEMIDTYDSSGSEDNQDDTISRDSTTRLTVQGSTDDVFSTHTPDSAGSLDNHDLRKYTPPLGTKVRTLPFKGLKCSNSDPSLHTTLTAVGHLKKTATLTQSTSFTKTEANNDSSDTNSLTPSICSFESGKGWEQSINYSPGMRKRVKSDVSHDHNSLAMRQKYQDLIQKKKNHRQESTQSDGVIEVPLVYADALMDRQGLEPDELSFSVNDVISILDMTDDDWWQGIVEDRIGWFPSSWVRLRINQDSDDNTSLEQQETGDKTPSKEVKKDDEDDKEVAELPAGKPTNRRRTIQKRDSIIIPRRLTPCEIRARCVEELITTEAQYVEHLGNIIEGFLHPCRERIGSMFTVEQVDTIFSNIEFIYSFQCKFLDQLEAAVNRDELQASQVGKIFIEMGHNFKMYSEYCNNHPHAVNEMNLLTQKQQYAYFFESCRLLKNLQTISLEGFLLTPVQRICRYPLQLSELLKYTFETHPDYADLVEAQEVMKQVAVLINEEKRRMENIGHANCWQETVENWKGEDVLVRSTELIFNGELHKISRGHSQERHFFLFDNQMIYCKKELGGKLSYKGRIDMNKCFIVDVKDGECSHNGSSVKHAWKINNADKDDKLYILFAKSSQSKQEWMEAFSREREIVERNAERDIAVTPKIKRAAVALYRAESKPIRGRNSKKLTNSIELTDSLPSKLTNSPTERKRIKNKRK